jgi:hypothetical protein
MFKCHLSVKMTFNPLKIRLDLPEISFVILYENRTFIFALFVNISSRFFYLWVVTLMKQFSLKVLFQCM